MTKVTMSLCVIAALIVPSLALGAVDGPHMTTTPITATLTDWNGSLSFPQFDDSLGVLVSVDLYLCGSMDTILTITNDSDVASSGTGTTEVQMTIQDALNSLPTPAITLFSPDYSYNLLAGQSTTSGTLIKSGIFSNTYTTPAVLAEFTGPGTIVLNANANAETWLNNTGGNTAIGQVTHVALTGSVCYNYIPEPATLSLLGFGLTALLRRRR